VSYQELRDRGIEYPASVVSELELAATRQARARTPRSLDTRFLDPAALDSSRSRPAHGAGARAGGSAADRAPPAGARHLTAGANWPRSVPAARGRGVRAGRDPAVHRDSRAAAWPSRSDPPALALCHAESQVHATTRRSGIRRGAASVNVNFRLRARCAVPARVVDPPSRRRGGVPPARSPTGARAPCAQV